MREFIKVSGYVEIDIQHVDGTVEHREGPNLVTTVGQSILADLITQEGVYDSISSMACGTSNQTPSKSDTDLIGTEVERVAVEPAASANTIAIVGVFGAAPSPDPSTIQEFGIFNNSPGGDLFARFITTAFVLTTGMVVTVTWRITFGG